MYTLADAFGSGIGAINSMYQTQLLKDTLATHPELLRAQLQLAKAQGNMGEAQAQYAPQNERNKAYQLGVESQFAQPMAQAGLGLAQAKIPNMEATTAQTKENTRLAPLNALLKAQQTAQVGSRFGAAYQALNAIKQMDPIKRALYISQHQEKYSGWINDLASKEGQNYITAQVMQHYFPELGLGAMHGNAPLPKGDVQREQANYDNSDVKPDVIDVNQGIGGNNANIQKVLTNAQGQNDTSQLPQNVPGVNQGRFPTTPQQNEQLARAGNIYANNAADTAATRRQYEGAQQAAAIWNDPTVQKNALDAAKYAGVFGQGKAAITALKKEKPQEYQNYLGFKEQLITLFENRLKTLDQMGSTDSQRKDLKDIFDKTMNALTSNPEQFIEQFNQLGEALDVVGRAVEKSATPIVDMPRLPKFKPIPNPYSSKAKTSKEHITDENIAHTAKLRGISEDEVRKKLKAKGLL
jgi:hypothetical protein